MSKRSKKKRVQRSAVPRSTVAFDRTRAACEEAGLTTEEARPILLLASEADKEIDRYNREGMLAQEAQNEMEAARADLQATYAEVNAEIDRIKANDGGRSLQVYLPMAERMKRDLARLDASCASKRPVLEVTAELALSRGTPR